MFQIKKRFKVAVVIACYNEIATIKKSIASVVKQTIKPAQIIIVDDVSEDGTWQVLKTLAPKIPNLQVYRCKKKKLKAGALNLGLTKLKDSVEFVLSLDADTQLSKDAIEKGLSFFNKFSSVGGVCSKAGLKKGTGLLYRLQKLEYGAGFDAERTATFENVMVLHGMCILFKASALREIGGFTEGHLIEDYDITVRLKKKGYRAMYNPAMKAYTLPPTSFSSLFKQRIRWARGGVDIILDHGISRHTLEDIIDHVLFIFLMMIILVIFIFSLFSMVTWRYHPHPLAIALGVITYFTHIYRMKFVKNGQLIDMLLRMIVIPELILSMIYSLVQIWAYILAIKKAKRTW